MITPPVVIAENQSLGEGKLPQAAGEPEIPVAEITDEQNGIRLQALQQLFIRCTPGTVQISSDGETKIGQSRCLGCAHPAPPEPR